MDRRFVILNALNSFLSTSVQSCLFVPGASKYVHVEQNSERNDERSEKKIPREKKKIRKFIKKNRAL